MIHLEHLHSQCLVGKKPSTRPSPAATSPTVNPYTRKAKYCFTCGLQPWHSSDKYKLGAPGHKKNATFANKLGGNETNHMVLKEWDKINNLGLLSSTLLLNNVNNDSIVTVADSGASGHYLTIRHTKQLSSLPAKFPITVKLPDGTRIQNIQVLSSHS